MLVDREQYIIRKKEIFNSIKKVISIDEQTVDLHDQRLVFEILETIPDPIPRVASTAILDFEKLQFPLQLRPWKAGDIFQPFGMNGQHQKVQDFLTHKKLSRFEKEKVYVLESAGLICWVVGFRIDERFRVGAGTERVYQIVLL